MQELGALSANESTTGKWWISRIGQTTAKALRNEESYDDWSYGTEPIPCDTSWVKPHTPNQLFIHLVDAFVSSESINHELLARIAMYEMLNLPEATLLQLRSQYLSNIH
jgi:hypothetical protein